MTRSFYFYDLETSGFNPKEARIMQFAGQRTDLKLKTLGDPDSFFIKMTNDILPDPGAVLLTGITPQQTISEGISEAEFVKFFHEKIATPDTIFVGYNSVRFDDEFMRYLNYRNFYDPYEWQWKDGRSRWDLLDVVRMTRALRPEGISWPIEDGKPTNQLVALTKANKIFHGKAHDALSDVNALIDLARLIYKKQPKLFDFLLNLMPSKNNITQFISSNDPFVYTSGKYPSEFEKTSVVGKLSDHPNRQGILIFDLRFDPSDYKDLSVEELVEAWTWSEDKHLELPVKTLLFNRCPAIAPLSVLDKSSQKRIGLSEKLITSNYQKLQKDKSGFSKKILDALSILDEKQVSKHASARSSVDGMLYDGFFGDKDRSLMKEVQRKDANDINTLQVKFDDKRLNLLLPLYKARNFPSVLTDEESKYWEEYRVSQLMAGSEKSRLASYFNQLNEILSNTKLSQDKRYLAEELNLYGESIMPVQQ